MRGLLPSMHVGSYALFVRGREVFRGLPLDVRHQYIFAHGSRATDFPPLIAIVVRIVFFCFSGFFFFHNSPAIYLDIGIS